jgi:hypothetical protein
VLTAHSQPKPHFAPIWQAIGVAAAICAQQGCDTRGVPLAEGERMNGLKLPAESISPSPGHEREWLDSIKTRKAPSCCPDYHCKVGVPLVLANLSLKLGRAIRFGPLAEKIVDDAEAARLTRPEYRAPWKFPAEYV